MSMQSRILSNLESKIGDKGYDPVIQKNFGNTGHLYVQEKNGFNTHLTVYFNFQSSYCSIHIHYGKGKSNHNPDKSFHYLEYNDGDEIQKMVDFIINKLD